jgi:hypothetical protein
MWVSLVEPIFPSMWVGGGAIAILSTTAKIIVSIMGLCPHGNTAPKSLEIRFNWRRLPLRVCDILRFRFGSAE